MIKLSRLRYSLGFRRLLMSVLLTLCFFLLLYFEFIQFGMEKTNQFWIYFILIYSWNFFCFVFLIATWKTLLTTSQSKLQTHSKEQDEGTFLTFVTILVLVCFSLLGLTIIFIAEPKAIHEIQLMLSLLLSWVLLHTIFTIKYAHMYYEEDRIIGVHPGGLQFPNDTEPDYIDFAYFAFVIGMTFQVSDISVTSNRLRRIVLMHSLLSFVFNVIIVSLAISIIANLKTSHSIPVQ